MATSSLRNVTVLSPTPAPPKPSKMRNKLLTPSRWGEDYFKFFSIKHFMQIPYLAEGYAVALIFLLLPLIPLIALCFLNNKQTTLKLRNNCKK